MRIENIPYEKYIEKLRKPENAIIPDISEEYDAVTNTRRLHL